MAKEKKRGPGRPKGSKNKSKAASSKEEIRALQEKRENSAKVKDIIWGICYIALGLIIFFAVQFHQAGEVGNTVGDILKGMLGVLGLVLPWYLVVLGILLITHVFTHFSAKTLIVSVVLMLLFCMVNAGMYIDADNVTFDIPEFYRTGMSLESGGVIGMTLGSLIVTLLGKAGLFIISIAGISICLLLTRSLKGSQTGLFFPVPRRSFANIISTSMHLILKLSESRTFFPVLTKMTFCISFLTVPKKITP